MKTPLVDRMLKKGASKAWIIDVEQLERKIERLTVTKEEYAGYIDALARQVEQLEAALTLIGDIAFDSDGYAGNAEKLGGLVGEIYGYARNPQTAVDALAEETE